MNNYDFKRSASSTFFSIFIILTMILTIFASSYTHAEATDGESFSFQILISPQASDELKNAESYPFLIKILDENGDVDIFNEETYGELTFELGECHVELSKNKQYEISGLPKGYSIEVNLDPDKMEHPRKTYIYASNGFLLISDKYISYAHSLDSDIELDEYAARFRDDIVNAETTLIKKWDKEEGDEVLFKIKWKFDNSYEVDAMHKAITVKGVDEATIIKILTQYLQIAPEYREAELRSFLEAYLREKDNALDEVLVKALLGHLEERALLSLYGYDFGDYIPSYVQVDEDGYKYILVKVKKSEGWRTTIKGIRIPKDAIVEEITEFKDMEMSWKGYIIDGSNNTVETPHSTDGTITDATQDMSEIVVYNAQVKGAEEIDDSGVHGVNEKTEDGGTKVKSAHTGDDTNLGLYPAVILICAISLTIMGYIRRSQVK